MINILLCGGSGTRLWPLSRTLMPTQFLRFFDYDFFTSANFLPSSFVLLSNFSKTGA